MSELNKSNKVSARVCFHLMQYEFVLFTQSIWEVFLKITNMMQLICTQIVIIYIKKNLITFDNGLQR